MIGNRRATRHGLTAGQLPKGAAYIKRCSDQFRVAIEQAVADRNGGQVSLYHAALIQSAQRWERHAMLSQRWLRHEADKLNADQRLAYSREVARASSERDKCLRLLGLDRSEFDHQLDQLYSESWPASPDATAGEQSDPRATSDSGPVDDAPDATPDGSTLASCQDDARATTSEQSGSCAPNCTEYNLAGGGND